MPKCPCCESKLEELTEITGYHYWMCGNSDCEMSYKFYRKQEKDRITKRIDTAGWAASSVETYMGNHAMLSQAFVRPFDLEEVAKRINYEKCFFT